MSTAPDMLRQFGGAPVGNAFGWKANSKVWFVDGDSGKTGGDAESPESACADISEAITLASEYDVIYVLDHGFSGSDPVAYKETVANLTIPLAKDGIALVGVTHQGQKGRPLSPYVMGMDATATPILTVNSPLCAIENLAFTGGWNNASTCTAGIYLPDSITGTTMPQGTSIYNCFFEDMSGNSSYGSIYAIGSWYINIVKTYHRNCVYAVDWGSSVNTALGLYVDDITTEADAVTKVSADVYLYTQGTSGIVIKNADFAHQIGTASGIHGGHKRYIVANGSERGIISNVHMAAAGAVTLGATGSGILAPIAVRFGPCWDGNAATCAISDA